MNITDKTKYFLRVSGWTQGQLAREIGTHPITLCRYLTQRKRKGTGEKLAEFLDSTVAHMAILEPEKKAKISPPAQELPQGPDNAQA